MPAMQVTCLLCTLFLRMAVASLFCPGKNKKGFFVVLAKQETCLLCSLFSRMVALPANWTRESCLIWWTHCQGRNKKNFFAVPATKVICWLFSLFLQVSVPWFYQEKSKKNFYVLLAMRTAQLLLMFSSKVVAVSVLCLEQNKKSFFIMQAKEVTC